MIRLPQFPNYNSKLEFHDSRVLLGGQVASAVVACAQWGLSTRYVGKVGDDDFASRQRLAMEEARVDAHWITVPDCQSQSTFILVDERTGERTILWKRDARLALLPQDVSREWVISARLLHVDGHDTAASARAAQWAREQGIPVSGDFDNLYAGVEALLENVNYVISSREFPERLTGESNLLLSLPSIASRFQCNAVISTLGEDGALAWDGREFHYHPAFEVRAIDTTGAGDIFHAAFAYAILQGWTLDRNLEFACAAGSLACLGLGARGGISPLGTIEEFCRTGRHRPARFSPSEFETAKASR